MSDAVDKNEILSTNSIIIDKSTSPTGDSSSSGNWLKSTSGVGGMTSAVSQDSWTGVTSGETSGYSGTGLVTASTDEGVQTQLLTVSQSVAAELTQRVADMTTAANSNAVIVTSTSENISWTLVTTNTTDDFGGTDAAPLLRHSHLLYTVLTCLILGAIILAAVVGNAFVIAAIILERNLHSVANYLIASLAVADLLVAALVMPLAAVNEISSRWFFGSEACDAFVLFDVLCCTASILHLVAISVDRYWAVTRVDYIHNRPVGRIVAMIGLSWAISTVISIPPMFGWKSPDNDPDVTGVCLISQDWGYTVYSTLGAFYIPLGFMIVIYLNVYRAARSRIRKKQFRRQTTTLTDAGDTTSTRSGSVVNGRRVGSPVEARAVPPPPPAVQLSLDTPTSPSLLLPPDTLDTAISTVEDGAAPMLPSTSPTSLEFAEPANGAPAAAAVTSGAEAPPDRDLNHTVSQKLSTERRATKKREQMRERKAARTLGVITGSFVTCWLPFFILALVRPFCGDRCQYPDLLVSVIGWLGYFNSLLNPIIYTVFNPDFRLAFRKILFGKYRGDARGGSGFGRSGRTRSHNGGLSRR